MASRFTFNRELLIRIFFFTAFIFLLYQVFLLGQPFLPVLLLACMLVLMFHPLYVRVRSKVKNVNIAAVLLTCIVILTGVLPFLGFGWLVFNEADRLIPTMKTLLGTLHNGELASIKHALPAFLQPFVERMSYFFGSLSIDPSQIVLQNIEAIGQQISSWGAAMARDALILIVKAVILVASTFFIFRDGDNMLRWFINLIPMEAGHKRDLTASAYGTFRAVTIGVFLTAAGQGVVALIGFLIAGVRLPVFLALATFVTSLLGVSSLITIPVALVVLHENTAAGVFLLIWGVIVVGLIDNWLRPVLIGSRARMPFFLVFISIIGGIKMYGILGLILGPILVASVLTFIRIYQETYTNDRGS